MAAGPAAVAPSDAAGGIAAGSAAIDAAQAPPDMLNRFLYNNMLHWGAQDVDALLEVYKADQGKLVVDALRFLEQDDQFQQVVEDRVLFPLFKALFYLLLVRTVVNTLKQNLTRENLNRLSTDLESYYNGNLAESISRMCGRVGADVSDDMLAPARELEELHRINQEATRELDEKIKEGEQRLQNRLAQMADGVVQNLMMS